VHVDEFEEESIWSWILNVLVFQLWTNPLYRWSLFLFIGVVGAWDVYIFSQACSSSPNSIEKRKKAKEKEGKQE